MNPVGLRAASRCRSDAGLGTVGGVVTVAALATITLLGVVGYRDVVNEIHRAVGSANVHTVAQAARVDETINGTDPRSALVAAAADCACGVVVAPVGTTLVFRSGNDLVEFDTDTGRTSTQAVSAVDSPPDISRFDGVPHTVPINLDPGN